MHSIDFRTLLNAMEKRRRKKRKKKIDKNHNCANESDEHFLSSKHKRKIERKKNIYITQITIEFSD